MTGNAAGPVLWEVDARGVATVTLNRPEVNNAYNGALLESLLAALDALGQARNVRAVLIKGTGKHFQAGADLTWIEAVRVTGCITSAGVGASRFWKRISRQLPALTRSTSGRGRLSGRSMTLPGSRPGEAGSVDTTSARSA